MGDQLLDALQVDNRRAVHALEHLGVEALFHYLHGGAQDMGFLTCVDAHVIAGGVDKVDIVDLNPGDAPAVLDVQVAIIERGPFNAFGLFQDRREDHPGRVFHLFDQIHQFSVLRDNAALMHDLPDPVDRRLQLGIVNRFQKVIQGMGLERFQGILVISGNKNHQRHVITDQRANHVKAVKTRHLDVKQHQVGLLFSDRLDRLAAVGTGGDDIDILKRLEPHLQPLQRQGFVINQDCPDGLHRPSFLIPHIRTGS